MNQKPLQISLFAASFAMIAAAALLWSGKRFPPAPILAAIENASAQKVLSQNADSSAAFALLKRSTLADNTLSYSALSQTVAFMGGHSLTSSAKITRAPRHLSIETLSGNDKGARSGYSQRWFWRRDAGQSLVPYAQAKLPADEIAAKRLPLLTENYHITFGAIKEFDGRSAQAIEIRPKRAIDGAQGPARRLWVDQESGLTLGIESFNCDLQPTSRSALSRLQIAPNVTLATFEKPAAIFASLSSQGWQGEELGDDRKAAAAKTGFTPPVPAFLPPGFKLDGYGVHRCRTTGTLQPAAFSRYCDGINTLTIFAFRPVNENVAKNMKAMRGGCNFGPSALASREDNSGRLVAIGDLPAKTLQRVLTSARFEMAR